MLEAGMMIGDRYEIINRIGSGGMADVYKAKDHKLNRFVAMKVLKQEFREDTTFIRKFKTEAQSAAGLTHPNIVNVFDVGDDGGIHYIVMELVEGITLKDYISKKGKLSVKEATSIAIQVSMGLEAAHSHNIVHRDVKPQNIIISTDGKVKVTDFGIARAASSNTISSNVMGSVHYSSPEQVRGGYSDEKSDIYSLGITLYEMVTGRVPFDGDTTVAIAIKHLQDEMVAPSEYTPNLPYSLEQIIFKCTQKSVDKRYGGMDEVIADLKHSLIDPNGNFVQLYTMNPNEKTTVIGSEELSDIKTKRAEAQSSRRKEPVFVDDTENDEDEEESGGLSRGLEKAMMIGGFLVGALIIVVLAIFIIRATGLFTGAPKEKDDQSEASSEEMVPMPNLLGKTEDEAVEIVAGSGIGIQFNGEEPSDEYDKGMICYQEIPEGTEVPRNSTIKYKLSSGSALIGVPDVVGHTQAEAEQTLKDLGFAVNVSKSYSDEYQAGLVINQDPSANSQGRSGDTISLEVSMGSQYDGFTVPYVVGMTELDAKSALAALDVTVQSEVSETAPEGQVTAQSIAEGVYVDKGTSITITVSTGSADATETPSAPAGGEWKCTQQLDTPTGYQGGVVKMELVQTVGGSPKATTVVDGKQVEFPYQLDLTGVTGVSDGTLYLSELIGTEYVELGHYPLTFEPVEEE